MLLFVTGFLCFQLGLSSLTTLFYAVAAKIMLLAFGLMVLLGALAWVSGLHGELRSYFRREAIALRRVWSAQTLKLHLAQRMTLERRQLHYFNQFKRQRLLVANNKKHVRALYLAIYHDLQQVRKEMPDTRYQTLYKALRQHHKRADAEAMLALRQQIPCR